jgi:hypothetical protein
VGHVDERERNPALAFAISNLAEAWVAGKAFVFDYGIVLKMRLAAVETGLDGGARNAGFRRAQIPSS